MRGDETSKELSSRAEELVQLARRELGEMSIRRRAEGFAKLHAERSPSKRRVRLLLGLATAVTALALALIARNWFALRNEGPLSYAVDGGRIAPGGAVEANGTSEPVLRFSDGTEVVFVAGGRGRVRSVDGHGARIAVTGKAKVEVVPWRGSHWLFDVGPFLITVKGTAFTAEWKDAEERLEVVLKTGSVAVSGPSADEAITLRAGQRLIISIPDKEVVIRDIDSPIEGSGAASAARKAPEVVDELLPPRREATPAGKLVHRALRPSAAPPPSASSAEASNWSAELAAGHFAIILQQAEARGLETSLAEASSEDLAALADAARYSRREDIARGALMAQMRRFPRSARANDAAFLLGRLEETTQHIELALGWYERCLESPRGTYTSEALGRKMTLVQRLHGAARARPIAEEYLRRFEDGTYAAAARALTRAP
jgi:hypothetical protein